MVDTVWIARHGNRQDFVDPDWMKTAPRPYDPGLSPDGVGQARRLAERLQPENIGVIVSSPFLRTVETANQVADLLDLPIFVEPGLSEWLNPEWFPHHPATLSMGELHARFPRVDLGYSPHGFPSYPETEDEAMRRAAEAAHAVVKTFADPVLFVGHGVSVAGVTVGLDEDAVIRECGLCCLFKVVRNGSGWEMKLCADVSHLEEAEAVNRFI